MNEDNYVHYKTFFDIEQYRKTILLLKEEKIDVQIVDKSNQTSYRAPLSTYIEIDLLVSEIDFEKTNDLLISNNL